MGDKSKGAPGKSPDGVNSKETDKMRSGCDTSPRGGRGEEPRQVGKTPICK